MFNALSLALFYLAHLGFMILIFALWIRIMFRYLRFSPVQPMFDLILAMTNPLVNPIYQLSKWQMKPGMRIEWPTVVVLVLVEFLKFVILPLLAGVAIPGVFGFVLYILFDLIVQPARLLFWLIIIRMLASWLNPTWNHPAAMAINVLTNPVLKLSRYLIPEISGYDISPFIALVTLKLVDILLTYSLPAPLL